MGMDGYMENLQNSNQGKYVYIFEWFFDQHVV